MSDLRTKKELLEVVQELSAKLKEMKGTEKQLNISAAELSSPALGLHKDASGKYHIVELKYDFESKAAVITGTEALDSTDPSIASFKLKKRIILDVYLPCAGGKYYVK